MPDLSLLAAVAVGFASLPLVLVLGSVLLPARPTRPTRSVALLVLGDLGCVSVPCSAAFCRARGADPSVPASTCLSRRPSVGSALGLPSRPPLPSTTLQAQPPHDVPLALVPPAKLPRLAYRLPGLGAPARAPLAPGVQARVPVAAARDAALGVRRRRPAQGRLAVLRRTLGPLDAAGPARVHPGPGPSRQLPLSGDVVRPQQHEATDAQRPPLPRPAALPRRTRRRSRRSHSPSSCATCAGPSSSSTGTTSASRSCPSS